MPFFPQLEGQSLQQLKELFRSEVPDAYSEERELWFQEIAARIAQHDDQGVDWLVESLLGADSARVRAILFSFSLLPSELALRNQVQSILVHYLGDSRPLLVAEAIDSLGQLRVTEVLNQLLPLLTHPSPYVVGSVLRYLSALYPGLAKQKLLKALESTDPIVRENAIDELEGLGCQEAVPHLRALLRDPNPHVRQAAVTAIRILESN